MKQSVAALAMAAFGVAALITGSFVWSRRQGGAGRALTAMLVATSIWCLFYAAEMLADDPTWILRWGDMKYVGIGGLGPSWVCFVLCWTGRGHLVTPRLVSALLIEPALILALLAIPDTHDLVRLLAPEAVVPGRAMAEVLAGPVFWAHLVYLDVVMLGAVAVFIVFLLRKSDVYRVQVVVLIGAALLPWLTNLGYNLQLGVLSFVDLTPAAFTLSCGVLAWGLLRQHLLRLAPIAQRQVVAGMNDAVLVLDIFGHLVESNPAGDRLLASEPGHQVSRTARYLPPQLARLATGNGPPETRLMVDGRLRDYEVQTTDLPDDRGHAGGRLVVLRDITERRRRERQLATLLSERARVADTLSRSLRPDVLPAVPGVRLAAAYRPAGAGREIGGDFYDVYATDRGWAFAIGDVSGKGASAAAVTALARYSLRAFTTSSRTPSRTLALLNQHVVDNQTDETYLTVAHGRFAPTESGSVSVSFALGGHPPPLLICGADGTIRSVGKLGGVVGLFAHVSTQDTSVTLAPGDSLVFYTDGITEARRGPEFFGEDGLVRVLSRLSDTSADRLSEGILSAVLDFQGHEASDDIAALIIQAPRREQEDGPTAERM